MVKQMNESKKSEIFVNLSVTVTLEKQWHSITNNTKYKKQGNKREKTFSFRIRTPGTYKGLG